MIHFILVAGPTITGFMVGLSPLTTLIGFIAGLVLAAAAYTVWGSDALAANN